MDKKEWLRSLKFLLFSISAGVIQIGSFTLMNEVFEWNYVLSSYIAITLSVLWNFTVNRKFTFKSAANVPIAMLETLGYYAVFAPLSIHLADLYLVKTLGWNEILVQAISMIINFVTEFLFQRFVVYRNKVDTAKSKKEKQLEKEQQAEQTDTQSDEVAVTKENSQN